jgi:hypothetical protein
VWTEVEIVTGLGKKSDNEELYDLYSSPNIVVLI